MAQNKTKFQELVNDQSVPVVVINKNSFFILVNEAFEKEYGWSADDLIGKSITEIIPVYLRDAHQVGFSRFLITEQPTLMGKSLPLSVLYKDGTIQDAEHYITAEKVKGEWQFAASIIPIS